MSFLLFFGVKPPMNTSLLGDSCLSAFCRLLSALVALDCDSRSFTRERFCSCNSAMRCSVMPLNFSRIYG